jgi:hypothetical protein
MTSLKKSTLTSIFFQCVTPSFTQRDDASIEACMRMMLAAIEAHHERNKATEDKLMEQAQVFASAWSLIGGQFDDGSMHDSSLKEKEELRSMIAGSISTACVDVDEKKAGK